ncbi:tRNA (N6-threonylcarbamoyladenosine(37)-N6)-methyltransferase TrmO [Methanogenium organophilum]|uniref:tRNA (N6-threonylcarbamoyladenosine(37)-N6)-methyltransferase TrmO n=1 Tax=Methanogenium organophilum TaxID=2199 RepID=A0A9X9T853_METOG|nr:tRNA (N6-threonylcarbamoyladenosine(37)-N6)-methyltransferase TrmO [Methanogenium organophilum]WAI02048.1 tRNA (N6-threonylcarbamoyladenosine(37)-N6)-methyltransferase TrmO [Methanogenium organophilum]
MYTNTENSSDSANEADMINFEEVYGDMILRPIGIVRNTVATPPLVAGKDGLKLNGAFEEAMEKFRDVPDAVSEIILKEEYAELCEDIEAYSHLVIIYWGHEITEDGRSLKKVHPMGVTTNPLTGLFCTCSPARPNPVLIKVVPLVRVKGNVLTVLGLDAIDKSPVIDIKPYVREFYPQDGIRIPEWMQKITEEYDS